MIQASTNFEIILEDENKPDKLVKLMTGKIAVEHDNVASVNEISSKTKLKSKISSAEFYRYWYKMGYNLSDLFVSLRETTYDEKGDFLKIT